MVTEWALKAILAPLTWITSLIPGWTPPDWIGSVNDFVESTATNALQLDNWVPFNIVGIALIFTSACFLIALTVRLVRIVASHIPMVGGSSG